MGFLVGFLENCMFIAQKRERQLAANCGGILAFLIFLPGERVQPDSWVPWLASAINLTQTELPERESQAQLKNCPDHGLWPWL